MNKTNENIITRRKSMRCDEIFLLMLLKSERKAEKEFVKEIKNFFVLCFGKIIIKENFFHLKNTPAKRIL